MKRRRRKVQRNLWVSSIVFFWAFCLHSNVALFWDRAFWSNRRMSLLTSLRDFWNKMRKRYQIERVSVLCFVSSHRRIARAIFSSFNSVGRVMALWLHNSEAISPRIETVMEHFSFRKVRNRKCVILRFFRSLYARRRRTGALFSSVLTQYIFRKIRLYDWKKLFVFSESLNTANVFSFWS